MDPKVYLGALSFTPLEIKTLGLRNRLVLPPMCQYAAGPEGLVTPYHLAHYGARALGGMGLVLLEATAVHPDGRISGNDLGLWSREQIPGLKSLAEIIAYNGAVPGIQIAHAGRKAWRGVKHLVGPSALAFSPDHSAPNALTAAEITELVHAFTQAALYAWEVGFKVIEIHAAHGYLLHEFLSPIANHRTDEYGGSSANRLRMLQEVVQSCRRALPMQAVLTVRISAAEFSGTAHEYTPRDAVEIAAVLAGEGIDAVHASAGGIMPVRPNVWPGYQLGFARQIKQAVGLPVIGVGVLGKPELVEFALREGYCDLVAVGRALLADPHWPIRAARTLGADIPVPEHMRLNLSR
ncbi:MAG: NADPH dehydrogenase [Firmicutes bacterium]|nr:NADPH dehydrogenase [Bacillota bacterium]